VFGHGAEVPGDELNSPASFERVRALPCDGVEFDVRRTLDDGLAVIHDPTLPDGRDVAATAAAELPVDVLQLADVLELFRDRTVNVELKNHPGDPHFDPEQRITHRVIELLASRGYEDRVLMSSFGVDCVDEWRRKCPDVPAAQLLLSRRPAVQLLDAVAARGIDTVHPYDTMVDQAFMDAARERDLAVNVWTAEDDSEARLRTLIELGVDGIITGATETALRLRDAAHGHT